MSLSTNDHVNRRTRVDLTGTAVTAGHVDWDYNERSEVTEALRYDGSSAEIAASRRLYEYDPIGNRTERTHGTSAELYYCSSADNQYTTTDNTDDCPPSTPTEQFTYDDDGNLTQDGTFDYTWDGENRLIAVQTRVDLGASGTNPDSGDRKLTFKYDYMGRRVEKHYQEHNGTAWVNQGGYPDRFVYDGWNLVLTLDSGGQTEQRFTWGLDVSGLAGTPGVAGIHGAGGVGGLLAYTSPSLANWLFYDGNGNVVQRTQPDFGLVNADIEYDPYGNRLNSGSGIPPFRFSTKFADHELGAGKELYYYGHRYYSPRMGRWLSRDPLKELGGLNLLGALGNDPINSIDLLGDSTWVAGGTPAAKIAVLAAATSTAILMIANAQCGHPLEQFIQNAMRKLGELEDILEVVSGAPKVTLQALRAELAAAIAAANARCPVPKPCPPRPAPSPGPTALPQMPPTAFPARPQPLPEIVPPLLPYEPNVLPIPPIDAYWLPLVTMPQVLRWSWKVDPAEPFRWVPCCPCFCTFGAFGERYVGTISIEGCIGSNAIYPGRCRCGSRNEMPRN